MVMIIIDSSWGEKIYTQYQWHNHMKQIFKVNKVRYKILGELEVNGF